MQRNDSKKICQRNEWSKSNNPVCLVWSIVDISKIVMYEYWYDYIKPNYGDNVKICYVDTDNLIVHVKLEDVYADLAKDL